MDKTISANSKLEIYTRVKQVQNDHHLMCGICSGVDGMRFNTNFLFIGFVCRHNDLANMYQGVIITCPYL